MSRFLSGYWLLVPLLLLAIVIRNWVEEPRTLRLEEPLTMQRLQADFYLEHFTTRRFGEDGELEYLLTGESLSHYPDDDRAEIVEPRMRLREPGVNWSMRASGGRLTRSPDVVTLLDDVVLRREPVAPASAAVPDGPADDGSGRADVPANGPVVIRTQGLSIALDTRDLSTAARVVVEGPGMRLEATGLRSSTAEGKLELLSNVTGRYEVAPRASE